MNTLLFEISASSQSYLVYLMVFLICVFSFILYSYFDKMLKYFFKRNKPSSGFKFYTDSFDYRDYTYNTFAKYEQYIWQEVEKIFLFKRGLLGDDQIGLSLKMTNEKEMFITEDVEAWQDFLKEIDKHIPSAKIYEEILEISQVPFEEKGWMIFNKQETKNFKTTKS